MADGTRIVIAEDHTFFRDGLRQALESDSSLQVVAEASDGAAAFECIKALRPDVAIVDIGMPRMNGIELLKRVHQEGIAVRFIFLTVCDDEEMFDAALELGVKGYLLKDCTRHEILKCVEAVLAGHCYLSPSITTYAVQKARAFARHAPTETGLERLTMQERAVLLRIADQKSSKEIAQELGISPRTVDTHRLNICKKLGIHGAYGLSRFAADHRDDL